MANPTTNYGFVLPTSTDLVTDLPADFDVALQGVDTRLKALQPGTTLGDLVYSSATANTNTRRAIGTTGQVLTVSGGVPVWATPAGGGKVLQVVMAQTTTSTAIATTTYTDTTLTASITPSATSSKVLVLISQNFFSSRQNDSWNGGIKIVRNSTDVLVVGSGGYEAFGNFVASATEGQMRGMSSLVYLDSPATTSATTYKTQGRPQLTTNSGQVTFQSNSAPSTIILLEIGA